ncbi:unnamed protein product [Timema podura]|uniref:Lateral signaling target protein 2 homolog n=2 Tax=Timema TaxID=61471 RepID=A0ABN7NDS5_TIMPD|nr:unnamed protein product [Timema podura]
MLFFLSLLLLWLQKDDTSLLAQFFYADEALNMVAAELDSFDGRKDPERCTSLVNHLRQCQDKVLTICSNIMDEIIPEDRANRDFRVKFPDDVMQENLAGQLWFGAECLAAGSSIMNRENESSEMRPLAKALTKALENVRNFLREQCLRGPLVHSGDMFCERLQEALKIFDRLFAEFELCYVSAMVPVKTPREYEVQQFVVVLFSETLQRALQMKLLNQEMVDDYDPALMFTIPRLAIVSGLLIFPDGPLCLDKPSGDMSEMFRPFRTLLFKIRELLWTLNKKELFGLEKLLCSSEEPNDYRTSDSNNPRIPLDTADDITYPSVPDLDDFVTRFYIDYPNCKQFVTDFYTRTAVPSSCVDGDEVSESDEDTEWVGETSECDSVATEVFRVLDSETGSTRTVIRVSGDSWSNGSITPLDAPDSLLGVISANSFNTCQVSSSLSATINDIVSEPLERHEKTINDPCCENNLINTDATELVSNNIDIPITSSGFLIANQVGHEAMMATVDGVPPRSPIVSPSGAQSLPDGDSGEAMSVATATLSTLLLRSSKMSPGVYHREPSIGEDDSNTQSPLDSGVGTVLSCSETGSLSDRSPDAESCEVRETTHQGKHSPPRLHWQLETIACRCTSSRNCDTESISKRVILNTHCSDHKDCLKDKSETQNCSLSPQPNDCFCDNFCGETCNNINSFATIKPECSNKFQPNEHSFKDDLESESCVESNNFCSKHSLLFDKSTGVCSECVVCNCKQSMNLPAESVNKLTDTDSDCDNVGVYDDQLDDKHNVNFVVGPTSLSDSKQLTSISDISKNLMRSEFWRNRRSDCDSNCVVNKEYVDKVLPNILIRTEGEEWVGMMSEEGQYTVCNDNLNNVRTSDLNYSENWESLMTQHSEEPSSSESKLSLPSSSSSFKSLVAKETRKLDVSPSYDHHSQHPPIMVVSKRLGRSLEAPAASSYSSTCSSCQSSISGNSDRSSDDLIHRLFVCIAGVADQLQTNFAGDLRNILKSVFLINASCSAPSPSTTPLPRELERSPSPSDNDPARAVENAEEALSVGWESPQSSSEIESPPPWIPDDMAPRCMSCETVFTVVRRRHHCRNCGKVFCARCSSNSVPLPRYGHVKPVRVCNRCFLYQVTPFMLEELATRS